MIVLMTTRKYATAASVLLVLLLSSSCLNSTFALHKTTAELVKLSPIDVDPRDPSRKEFGQLTLLSAYRLESKDRRFGGLSGLAVGSDGNIYAISDNGYWVSARMQTDQNGVVVNLDDWRIAPVLGLDGKPVTGSLRDAESLAHSRDGSFIVAFESEHRI